MCAQDVSWSPWPAKGDTGPGDFMEEREPCLSHLLECVSGSREVLRTLPGDLGPLGTTCAVCLA